MHSFTFNVHNAMNDAVLGTVTVEAEDQESAADKAQFIIGKRVYIRPA